MKITKIKINITRVKVYIFWLKEKNKVCINKDNIRNFFNKNFFIF